MVLLDKLRTFWTNMLNKLKGTNEIINDNVVDDPNAADAGNKSIVNFYAMLVKKVLNMSLLECSFDVRSKNAAADKLKALCENIESNIYTIGQYMLTGYSVAECWVVPCINESGEVYHSILDGSRICIFDMQGDKITDCAMIFEIREMNSRKYMLCRRHTLDRYGNLHITFFITDENSNVVDSPYPDWNEYVNNEVLYPNANNIGFGRYKSPVIAIGNTTPYGKPLNYGCEKIEKDIQTCLEQIRKEFLTHQTKLFADETIIKSSTKDWTGNNTDDCRLNAIEGFIYATQKKAGVEGNMIDVFSPGFRDRSLYNHLHELCAQYENQVGVNAMLYRDETVAATATEIRTLNFDNIAIVGAIRDAIDLGNLQTLIADSMMLGIPADLWKYDSTYKEIYTNEQQQIENNLRLFESGAMTLVDLIMFWYPNLSEDDAITKADEILKQREKTSQREDLTANMKGYEQSTDVSQQNPQQEVDVTPK